MFEDRDAAAARPLWLVAEGDLAAWLATQDEGTRAWLTALRFRAERHQVTCIARPDGSVGGAVLGLGALGSIGALEPWHIAGAVDRLPGGPWRIETPLPAEAATAAALGWAHGSYRFERYRSKPKAAASAVLVPPQLADMAYVRRMAAAIAMARDFINTPAADLSPEKLAEEALALARANGAEGRCIIGDALREGYPAIHAVGQAAAVAPRLVDFTWGDPAAPKVTLVGKGVCFDTGGLDIKPPAGMLLMKKDMGGAACVLALARMVMESSLPVRLRVLVPAVENSIAGNAYRPGDVLRTRKGITVEVGNTDAEGRLILCDALALADTERPDLLIDLATLRTRWTPCSATGAASPTHSGRCRSGPVTTTTLRARSPTSTTSRVRPSPGRSSVACSSSASSPNRATGCTSTCSGGTPRIARAGRWARSRRPCGRSMPCWPNATADCGWHCGSMQR